MAEHRQPVHVKTFTGETQEAAAQQFAADAADAARHGYTPASQAWDGTTLNVIYQQQDPQPPAASPEPPRSEKPTSVSVSQSGGGLSGGVGQGFGLGAGCMLFLVVLVAGCAVYVSSVT